MTEGASDIKKKASWKDDVMEQRPPGVRVSSWTLKAPIWSWHVKDGRGESEQGSRAEEKDGTTAGKDAHHLVLDWVIRSRN